MSLQAHLHDVERRVNALREEIQRDERALAYELARAERAERNVERWWFGGGRLARLWALVRYALRAERPGR